eukprot:CAMPEP_0181398454 /NCGR_PEP_ID=MMETSP1110-20121109/1047_1 /TAXON_ID=174948 /ORGANISM="Symbiodinium sp., Strain CCMP421" /LENGTH=64 /DNA_ID=CAMNT_0023520401 /DNA_START=84 /DNA_END=274 /DNA_ORIENTATION=+
MNLDIHEPSMGPKASVAWQSPEVPQKGPPELSHSQDPRKLSEDTLGERLPRPGRNLHNGRVQDR